MHECPYCEPGIDRTDCDHLAAMYSEGDFAIGGTLSGSSDLLLKVLQDWVCLTRCKAPLEWVALDDDGNGLRQPSKFEDILSYADSYSVNDSLTDAAKDGEIPDDVFELNYWFDEKAGLENIYKFLFESMIEMAESTSPDVLSVITTYDPDDPDDPDDIPGMSFGSTCLWREDAKRVAALVYDFLTHQSQCLRVKWQQWQDE